MIAADAAPVVFALAVTALILHAGAAALLLWRAARAPDRSFWLPLGAGLCLVAASRVVSALGAWTETASGTGDVLEKSAAIAAALTLAASLSGLAPLAIRARSRVQLGEEGRDEIEQSELFETLFRLAPDALFVCSEDGVVLDVNDAAVAFCGRTREELVGAKAAALLPGSVFEDSEPDAGDGAVQRRELTRPNGKVVSLDLRSRELKLEDETLLLVSAREATRRRQLEDQIHGQQSRLALVVNHLPACIWTADRCLEVTSALGKGLEQVGLRPARLVGTHVDRNFAGVPGGPEMIEHHRRALAGEQVPFRFEFRDRLFEGVMSAVESEELEREVVGIALDITDRLQAENESRASELRLHEILEHAPLMVLIKDLDLRVTYVNREWERVTGYPRTVAIGKRAGDVLPAATAEEGERQDREALTRRRPLVFTEEIGRGGRQRSFSSVKFPLQHPDGTPYAVCALIREVTERMSMQEELRRRSSLLDEAQSMARLASWEADLTTDRRYWSPNLYAMLGVDRSIGPERGYEAYLAAIPEEERQEFLDKAFTSFVEGNSYRFQHRIVLPGGQERWLRVQGRIDRDENGKPLRVYGFAQDTTAEHEAAEEIAKLNERLEETVAHRTGQFEYARKELSTFSYAVSHDLRQPLRAIAGYVALLDEEVGAALPKATRDCLDRVRLAARRMDATIDALLSLTRLTRATLHPAEVDASAMAREIAAELAVAEPERKVEWQIEPGLQVYADSGLLRIVLQNLLDNAFKFTRGTSAAHIELGREASGDAGSLFVRDDGAGFEAAAARRLFQPFQRLHGAGDFEGTGIGLATVARILQRHGGWIRAESRPGHGATFHFWLPPHGSRSDHD